MPKKGSGKESSKMKNDKEEESNNKATDGSKDKDSDDSGKTNKDDAASLKLQNLNVGTKDLALRILGLCQKSDWAPVEQLLKFILENDASSLPFAGVVDTATGMTPLMYAVKENRLSLLDKFIELGSDVSAKNHDNYNALHLAAMYSREDVVKLLLTKKGVDIYETGGIHNQNAAHLVASRQTTIATAILKTLIHRASDIITKADGRGKIPLLLSVEVGNVNMCKELLNTQAKEQIKIAAPNGDTALHIATRRKDINMIKILMEHNCDVNAQNGNGQTPLHVAVATGDETLVKYFYTVKASATIVDNKGRTPIHIAVENGFSNLIELLVDKFKVNIGGRTNDGSTLVHLLSAGGHPNVANMLFKKGIQLYMPDKHGARGIHTAAKFGQTKIIIAFLQKGENVDVINNDNYTPLHVAAESCQPQAVETLLGFGANVHIKGGILKETALHMAARVKGADRCAYMLLKSGASPNSTTEDGQTPVHIAAKYGNLQTLLLLLEDGGDPLFKNKNEETPLHLASKNCQPDLVKKLINFVKKHKGNNAAKAYVNDVNANNESALHYVSAVKKEELDSKKTDKDVVKILLENGADINLQTSQQDTALHYAAVAGNSDVLMEMISTMTATDAQKALNKQNHKGWTPLLIAAHRGHYQMVNNLLINHARVDVFDNDSRSALHLAAEGGYLEICDLFLKNKAFINSKSRIGQTPLHLASMKGYVELVKFLIKDYKAATDILTMKKQTPLYLAAAAGQLEVCHLLLKLGANIHIKDEQGQKPIHVACQNNYSEIVKLFMKRDSSLISSTVDNGNTCAHIAAAKGNFTVIEELLKFDRMSATSVRNKYSDETPLQMAAEGGHVEVVKVLVKAGAFVTDENKEGFTAVHLAAKKGHGQVLEALRSQNNLRLVSKKLGMTPIHVAAYYGEVEIVRELLTEVPGGIRSDIPIGNSLVPELGSESGMTPLHLAAFSGKENVVRLLLNSQGVQVRTITNENGYNPLHLACMGGHVTVVSLLLNHSSDLLESQDTHGRTGLHIASSHGHYQMVEVLLGQGAEINASDKEKWTPLHCASKAGHFDVVQLLTESGASPISETKLGAIPIWYAVSQGHNNILDYLLTKEHNTYALMADRNFVFNLMVCAKKFNNKQIKEFVLVSPIPVDTAAKLSKILIDLSYHERERAKDLIDAAKFCEAMATELMVLASGTESAGKILTAIDKEDVEFLDILIENDQREVVAHTVVQRYLQEVWRGPLDWPTWRVLLLFLLFLICPPVWIAFSLPLGHKYYTIPLIKFMSYLTSHIYLMLFLMLVAITPVHSVVRSNLYPYSYEWLLLIWLSGLLLFELTNPSDKSGLGWIRLSVLASSVFAVGLHLLEFLFKCDEYCPLIMYCRNQLFALSFVLACIQVLDFLSFHHLFGPWAIIIRNLVMDLSRFLIVLALFIFGFSMQFVALNQPFSSRPSSNNFFSDVTMDPLTAFELLFFALFGQTEHDKMIETTLGDRPTWIKNLFKAVYGSYMLVSVVVLTNLLIAMLSDTCQRLQAQSDIDWKFGLSKLIRTMHRTSSAPSPINLVTSWLFYFMSLYKNKEKEKKYKKMVKLVENSFQPVRSLSPLPKAVSKWLSLINKTSENAQREPTPHPTELPTNLSKSNLRIEHVSDWALISKKYRILMGEVDETKEVPSMAGNS